MQRSDQALLASWVVVLFLFGMWLGRFAFAPVPSSLVASPRPQAPVGPKIQKRPQAARKVAKRPSARRLTPRPRARATRPQPKTAAVWKASDLPHIAFHRLPAAKRRLAVALLNQLKFACSCGQTIATCARYDLTCTKVQKVIEFVLNAVNQGESMASIRHGLKEVATASTPRSPRKKAASVAKQGLKPGVLYHVPTAKAPSRGPATAALTLVLFSDFQCPFCPDIFRQVRLIEAKYGAQNVRLVFRNNPLPMHRFAPAAAEAALAAHAQGKFWKYHDKLIANRYQLEAKHLANYAKALKLDLKKFEKDLKDGRFRQVINRDMAFAQKMRLPGAPFVFINGLPVVYPKRIHQVAAKAWKRAQALLKRGVRPELLYTTLIQKGKKQP